MSETKTNGRFDGDWEIKKAFIANPAEARAKYGRELSHEKILGCNTLYHGNCVLKKDCIEAMHKFMGFEDEIKFIKSDGKSKHHIRFTIGDIICYFAVGEGKGARIQCKEGDKEKMRQFAELMFPAECVHFVSNH